MSYTFVSFNLASTATAMSVSLLAAYLISKNMNLAYKEMQQDEKMSPIRGVAILYARIPKSIFN